MKIGIPGNFSPAWYATVVCLVVGITLAGCGDGSLTTGSGGSGTIIAGVGTGGTGVIKSSLTESSAATGLIGAVVFLDKNGNMLPDPDEPTAVTDQDGVYQLTSDAAEASSYPVLIQAVAGKTILKATGQVVTDSSIVRLER